MPRYMQVSISSHHEKGKRNCSCGASPLLAFLLSLSGGGGFPACVSVGCREVADGMTGQICGRDWLEAFQGCRSILTPFPRDQSSVQKQGREALPPSPTRPGSQSREGKRQLCSGMVHTCKWQ